jgi:hypothetical protein
MKSAPEVREAIRTQHELTALPKLIADWNMNRYFDTKVDNIPSEDINAYDAELFPIESIVEPIRPGKGINKALVGASMVADEYADPNDPRFYTASPTDRYKYWISPKPSNALGVISDIHPHVIYGHGDGDDFEAADVQVNKIVIKIENTWASPVEHQVQVTYNGGTSWTTVGGYDIPLDNDGQIILYWNGSGWVRTKPADMTALRSIQGIRLEVTKMGPGRKKDGSVTTYDDYVMPEYEWKEEKQDWKMTKPGYYETKATTGANSHLSVIAIEAHREVDLSDKVISTSDDMEAGEASQLNPVGTITSNTAEIELWNGDGEFNPGNPTSPYKDFLEPNVEMRLSYLYSLDTTVKEVPQFKMYVDNWSGQTDAVINLSLSDFSKFLKEIFPPAMMFENLSLREIVYRVCDSVGFGDFAIAEHEDLTDHRIPVFWTDGEMSVWEVLNELATATQSLIYFDHNGTLRVRTRNAAYDPERPVDWTLRAVPDGDSLPDIVGLSQTTEYEANVVRVMYKTTKWSTYGRGQPAMEVSWEPEGTVVLRAAPLDKALNDNTNAPVLYLNPSDAKIWPYEGIVNVEGEFIKYKGKEYVYFTYTETTTVEDGFIKTKYSNEQKHIKVVYNEDDYLKYRKKTPAQFRNKNHFNGALKIEERGVWNSRVNKHEMDLAKYNIRRYVGGERRESNAGFTYNKGESTITLAPEGNLKDRGDWLLATTGSADDNWGYAQYGMRFKFEPGEAFTDQIAGLVFNNSGVNEKGYFIEITPTNNLTAKDRETRQEVNIIVRGEKDGPNQATRRTAGEADTGAADTLLRGRDDGCDLPLDNGYKGPDPPGGGGGDGPGDGGGGDPGGGGGTDPGSGENPPPAEEGQTAIVGKHLWYDIDVYITTTGEENKHRIFVWVNGKLIADAQIPADQKQGKNSKFGFYIRGKSKATFEYLYAIHENAKYFGPPEDTSFFDRINGGYIGGFAGRELPYGWFTKNRIFRKKSTKEKNRKPLYFFDEFGPICHEVREYNVKFTNPPVLHSRLYMTNDWSAICTEYQSNPFEARFVVANVDRKNAVVNGEERVMDNTVEHMLNVIGRPLKISDTEELEFRNEGQVRARGEIEIEFESPWIQSKEAATAIGEWIVNHWGEGADEQSVTVFGNPLFEIGDMLAVDYPDKHLSAASDKYFVTAISTSFDNGITTSLTLRRA